MPTLSETLVEVALEVPGLDAAGDALAGPTNRAYAAAGEPGRMLKDVLNGTWLGHALHPAITDVPVGAWTAALVLDLLGERRGAKIAVGVGLLGAVGAAVTGLTDWLDTYGKPRRLGVVHAAVNGTAALLYTGSYFARDRAPGLGVTLSSVGYALVGLGALYGGTIALDLQIGVNHAHATEPPAREVDVGALSEIPDGGMRRVVTKGYPVLLIREGDAVSAIGAVCAHQGGPLEKGTLKDGVVTCPWHGSQFCARDGGIVHGPTAYPQPAFHVRVVADRVLLSGLKRS
jgi:nitrite reductase/ring-hydroxylating ferredoxin subunit/uncharacterized membrane protein